MILLTQGYKVNANIHTMLQLPGPAADAKPEPHDTTTATVTFQVSVVGLLHPNAQARPAKEHILGQADNEHLPSPLQAYQEQMRAEN